VRAAAAPVVVLEALAAEPVVALAPQVPEQAQARAMEAAQAPAVQVAAAVSRMWSVADKVPPVQKACATRRPHRPAAHRVVSGSNDQAPSKLDMTKWRA